MIPVRSRALMKKIVLSGGYHPHQKQARVHESGKRFVVISAGVRGGKTFSAVVEFLRRIYRDLQDGKGKTPVGQGRRRQPRLLYWVVAPTAALARVTHRYVLEQLPPELIEKQYESENSIWLRPDILIEVKTAERPDLLVAAAVNGMLLDEACRMKAEAWRGALRGRLTDTLGWAIFASSPLGGKNNWLYREVVQRTTEDPDAFEAISWTTADNPTIAPEEIEQARRDLLAAWFKLDYEASWDSFGGQIYDEFKDETHVIKEAQFRLEHGLGDRASKVWAPRLFRRVVCGVDFGFTAPGAMVVVG